MKKTTKKKKKTNLNTIFYDEFKDNQAAMLI